MEIKSNGKISFDAVYKAYAKKVRKIALYYTDRNYAAAEDIFQSVFIKLYENIEMMDDVDEQGLDAWIYTTTKRHSLNYIRDNNYEIPDPDIENTINEIMVRDGLEDEFVKYLKKQERIELLDDIYGGLYEENQRWYDTMSSIYLLDMPQHKVAETMGTSYGTIRTLLYRAREWIKKRYKKEYDETKRRER